MLPNLVLIIIINADFDAKKERRAGHEWLVRPGEQR